MEQLIKDLMARCPGCTFEVVGGDIRSDEYIRIVEYGRPFRVDLLELGMTAEKWFQDEIDRRPLEDAPPLEPDERYRVNCPMCGNVVIGYGNYRDQMARPDDKWYCPRCGNTAGFDDETYEEYGAISRDEGLHLDALNLEESH